MIKIVVTCEHGGNAIPKQYQCYFGDIADILSSHQGLDIGALQLARAFSQRYPVFFCSRISRLLVDLNRSLHHKQLFSSYTKGLNLQTKKEILEQYYHPYREQVKKTIVKLIRDGQKVLHLSVHSFTPVLNENERTADIGLLYDSKRIKEKQFCREWKENIEEQSAGFRVRLNYPYLGKADGLVAALRNEFSSKKYIGLELEVNQKNLTKKLTAKILEKLLVNTFDLTVKNLQ